MSGPTERAAVARRRPSLAAVVVLTVTWSLLWDSVSLFIVLTGVLLSLVPLLAVVTEAAIRSASGEEADDPAPGVGGVVSPVGGP